MKIRVYNIYWQRHIHEFPEEEILELPGDWFDYFSDDDKVKRLNKAVERELLMKHGVKPEFFICSGIEDQFPP